MLILNDFRFYRRNTQPSFSVVASVVRLAHQYQVKDLLDDALDLMKSCFSSKFSVWSAAREKMGGPLMSFQKTDAIGAVNLSRLTNTASVLPIASYMCCQLDAEV